VSVSVRKEIGDWREPFAHPRVHAWFSGRRSLAARGSIEPLAEVPDERVADGLVTVSVPIGIEELPFRLRSRWEDQLGRDRERSAGLVLGGR